MKYLIFSVVAVFLFACAGEDATSVDTKPPAQPVLYSHQGDTGEYSNGTYLNFYRENDSVYGWNDLENEHNGIDAVASTLNEIQIEWRHLTDNDLAYVNVHRFNTIDDDTLQIKQLDPNVDRFSDQFLDYIGPVGKDWFYYIDVFDETGNNTISDTVCYHLLQKPILQSPYDGESVTSLSDIHFRWSKLESIDVIGYRLLVFDKNRSLLWQYQPTDAPGDEFYIPYGGEENDSVSKIIWRVDAIGSESYIDVNGTIFEIPAGSESAEREIYVAK